MSAGRHPAYWEGLFEMAAKGACFFFLTGLFELVGWSDPLSMGDPVQRAVGCGLLFALFLWLWHSFSKKASRVS